MNFVPDVRIPATLLAANDTKTAFHNNDKYNETMSQYSARRLAAADGHLVLPVGVEPA